MTQASPIVAKASWRSAKNNAADGSYRNLPLIIGMTYLVMTFLLFLFWPVNWPIYSASSWISLIAYVSLIFVLLAWFFRIGTRRYSGKQSVYYWQFIVITGAIIAIILLFPLSYVYTDKWPWEVFEVLGQQGEAYSTLQTQLLETEGQRGPVAAVRALSAPLTFAVLPLGILHWRDSSWTVRGLVMLTALSTIILSILRGTDREFADLFIVGSSAFLILIARQSAVGGKGLMLVKKYWKQAVLALVFLSLAASLFTDRKSARLGGTEMISNVCANESRVCADIDAPAIRWMPLSQRFGLSFFILSTTSGYYGLTIAMEKDFESTYGVGHSPALLAIYELLTGDRQLAARTYTYRNAFDGWSEENYWSTLITWLANDVGFAGAAIILALIGFLWGKAWIAATLGGNDAAAVIFCIVMLMIFYLPANNQVFASYDGYTTFFIWLIIWGTKIASKDIMPAQA